MLLPWYAAPLVGAIAAIVVLLRYSNTLAAVLVYCTLPLASLCLHLFHQPLLMDDWVAVSMLLIGVAVFFMNRFHEHLLRRWGC